VPETLAPYLQSGGLPQVFNFQLILAGWQAAEFRTKGEYPGRDGCRVPLPWSAAGTGFGFSRTGQGSSPAEPWLPQPSDWGRYSVESQLADEHSAVWLGT
jgi:alpha-glucosidase